MDNDWRECINTDHHLCIMTIKANISHFISNAILSFTAIIAALYFLGEYAIRFVFLTEDYNDTLRQLPLKLQFPFESQQSPVFELLIVTIFLHVMLHACTVAILNGLIFTLVSHILYIFVCSFPFSVYSILMSKRFITLCFNNKICYTNFLLLIH